MDAKTLEMIFEIGGAVVQHIFNSVKNGNSEELRRLADVWPAPIKSRLALLAIETKARKESEVV